jgi:hypothetical protein
VTTPDSLFLNASRSVAAAAALTAAGATHTTAFPETTPGTTKPFADTLNMQSTLSMRKKWRPFTVTTVLPVSNPLPGATLDIYGASEEKKSRNGACSGL